MVKRVTWLQIPTVFWAGWRNHFSQLLNLYGVNDVGKTKIYTAEPLAPKPVAFGVEMAIGQLQRHISPGIDQILAVIIKAGGRTIRCQIHKRTNSIFIVAPCMLL